MEPRPSGWCEYYDPQLVLASLPSTKPTSLRRPSPRARCCTRQPAAASVTQRHARTHRKKGPPRELAPARALQGTALVGVSALGCARFSAWRREGAAQQWDSGGYDFHVVPVGVEDRRREAAVGRSVIATTLLGTAEPNLPATERTAPPVRPLLLRATLL